MARDMTPQRQRRGYSGFRIRPSGTRCTFFYLLISFYLTSSLFSRDAPAPYPLVNSFLSLLCLIHRLLQVPSTVSSHLKGGLTVQLFQNFLKVSECGISTLTEDVTSLLHSFGGTPRTSQLVCLYSSTVLLCIALMVPVCVPVCLMRF